MLFCCNDFKIHITYLTLQFTVVVVVAIVGCIVVFLNIFKQLAFCFLRCCCKIGFPVERFAVVRCVDSDFYESTYTIIVRFLLATL